MPSHGDGFVAIAIGTDATVCISFEKRFYFIFLNYIVSVRKANLIGVKVSAHRSSVFVRNHPMQCLYV